MGQWIEGRLSVRLFGIDLIRIHGKKLVVMNLWDAIPSAITNTATHLFILRILRGVPSGAQGHRPAAIWCASALLVIPYDMIHFEIMRRVVITKT